MLTASLLLLGVVLIAMGLAEHPVRRLPLSPAVVYLMVGWGVGAIVKPWHEAQAQAYAPVMVVVTEVAVLISLFAVGLRLRVPPVWKAWRVAALLATVGMLITIVLSAAAAHWILGLSWPLALLLGAVLAPTDPVLASEVQIRSENDRDAVRLSLTAEGGLNDGTALPAVMLALGLLGLHSLGSDDLPGLKWLNWFWADLLWPIVGGALLGWACGHGLGWAIRMRLRRQHELGWDELLYLGAIALSYGLARATATSAFLVVFVAGVALFHEGTRAAASMAEAKADSSHLSRRLLAFGQRCERLVEVSMVLCLGVAMPWVDWSWPQVGFALLLIFIVRPVSVYASLLGSGLPATQRRLLAWFGIRGVGSLFYLAFALEHGLKGQQASVLTSVCLLSIAGSILLHGVSATPVMGHYQKHRSRRAGKTPPG
ncbi:MAG: cation:proton antiporter [Burkholderiaceae bacterium]|nr:cation:proton antiporter [Burkholderiaceae bacterium]